MEEIGPAPGMGDTSAVRPEEKTLVNQTPLVDGEDYYLEGETVVFTKAYHLRRGYCCEHGCRHCPYTSDDER